MQDLDGDLFKKVKFKGMFEISKDFWKDTSFKIVPLALAHYFVRGIPVEQTIKNHTNIYDFCGRQKFKSDSYGEIRYITKEKAGNFSETCEKQQKTVRYFISNRGASFIKVFPEKDKESFINKGYQVTIFNKFVKKSIEDYRINYKFYELECLKVLEEIEDKQLNLF